MGLNISTADWPMAWDTAAVINGGGTYAQPRTPQTVTTDAVQSMAPVTNPGDSWSDFWRGAGTAILGYAIQKDAVQSGVAAPAGQPQVVYVPAPQGAARPQQAVQGQGLLLLALAGLVVYMVAAK